MSKRAKGHRAEATSDEVLGLFAKSVEPFPVQALYTELRSTTESRALVKYVRHSAEPEELGRHIQAGKQCTRLVLTWDDKISFVLTDGLELKRITLMDVIKEQETSISGDDEEIFNSEMALITRELGRLLADLLDELGDEKRAI